MKKMIIAAVGGAVLSGSLLGAGNGQRRQYYANCTEARAAGVAPMNEGEPRLRPRISIAITMVSPASSKQTRDNDETAGGRHSVCAARAR